MPNGGGSAGGWLRRVLVALALLSFGAAAWPAPAGAGATEPARPQEPTGVAELEAGFADRVADERRANGLGGLGTADDLIAVARRHSARMAGANRVFHNAGLPEEVAGWEVLGENVGRGPTVEEIHASFMASATHRAEILRPGFTTVGVGVVRVGDALWVTQVFRQPIDSPAPAERPSAPPAARQAPAVARPSLAVTTTTTTAATTTTTTTATTTIVPASPPAPPQKALDVAARRVARLARAPAVPPVPAVPAAGVLAAGLLWAVVAGATGVSMRQGAAPAR